MNDYNLPCLPICLFELVCCCRLRLLLLCNMLEFRFWAEVAWTAMFKRTQRSRNNHSRSFLFMVSKIFLNLLHYTIFQQHFDVLLNLDWHKIITFLFRLKTWFVVINILYDDDCSLFFKLWLKFTTWVFRSFAIFQKNTLHFSFDILLH